MSPHDKLIAAIFGCSPEDQAMLATEEAASNAAQAEKDWAEANRITTMAGVDFPEFLWMPALMYGWQACSVAITEDGKTLCAQPYGDAIGHYELSKYDLQNTEVKAA